MAKKRKPAASRFGQLPPRYAFALNPYEDVRFSKCPNCGRLTYPRKFPLLIHVDAFGPFVLGKTCRYCPKCEFIIAHQDELEQVLAAIFSQMAPEVVGNEYFVMGTVDKKVWRRGLDKEGTLEEIRPHTADIKRYMTLSYEPARWVPRGRNRMAVDEEYLDVLQNIEFAIVQVYRQEPGLIDFDVDEALDALIGDYRAEQQRTPRPHRLAERRVRHGRMLRRIGPPGQEAGPRLASMLHRDPFPCLIPDRHVSTRGGFMLSRVWHVT